MEFEIWHYWIIAATLFFILEIFLSSFVLVSVGIGCLFGMVSALFGVDFVYQLLFLMVGIIIGFVGVKPFMQRYAWQTAKEVATNYHALIGRVGKVCDTIDSENSGHIMLDGDTWQAVSHDDSTIAVGTKVKVIAIDSIIVTVKPIEKKIPLIETEDENENTPPLMEREEYPVTSKKLMVSVGLKQQLFNPLDIICCYSNQKITFLLLKDTPPVTIDDSLDKLEDKLPMELFFRANRQFIITPDCVREIKRANNGKLIVFLRENSALPESIIVSRLKAGKFKEWLNQHCEKI